ncbi:MAG: cobalamin biosynthesis protein [Methanobacterium sp.]|nr:cobalamin biosynthesis protein [Methanobacterium sp.]
MMELLFIIMLAVLLDLWLGEVPASIHPVVLMGRLTDFLKPPLLRYQNKFSGIVLTFIILVIFLIPFYFILEFLEFNLIIYILISSFILSTTFAIKALLDSTRQFMEYLDQDLEQARHSVSQLVSRDTSNLSREELASAALESLTENITDSVIAPLFYTFIFGVLGGMAYRVINTLDAMVGYKDPLNKDIGWFPAKLDDVANYLPARITGLLIVVSAVFMGLNWRASYDTIRRDARKTPSPNSGYPMAAAAGALGVQLEKKQTYILGDKINLINREVLEQALSLTQITVIFFLIISSIIYTCIMLLI